MPLIRGRVVDGQGHPVAGSRIMVSQGPVPVPDIAMLSGADGSFAMAVPAPGRWQLLAATDEAQARADVLLADGAAEVRVTLMLPLR